MSAWVNNGHRDAPAQYPLYPRKRTSELVRLTLRVVVRAALLMLAAMRRVSSRVKELAAELLSE
jgi:hypothetical protein